MRTVDSDEVYAAVGRVIVDAAFMEWTAGLLVATLTGEDRSYAENLCRRSQVMPARASGELGSFELKRTGDSVRRHLMSRSDQLPRAGRVDRCGAVAVNRGGEAGSGHAAQFTWLAR